MARSMLNGIKDRAEGRWAQDSIVA
jgi:hypothetical protein